MKQRFLNQKLGKRNSRRAELQKAKTVFSQSQRQAKGPPNSSSTTPPSSGETRGGKEG